MKKLTSLILTLSIILTLSACSDNTNNSMTDSGSSSEVSSAISSEASSESEAELTFDEKFRGLDRELRYDEVIELLGEPDKKGGENVKYLSYKQDDGKSAIVQFLYGDNPRIDYTYITDSETKEEEILLHRRICDHEKGYCSFDVRYSEEMRNLLEKSKRLKVNMGKSEVAEIFGEPYDYYYGSLSGAIVYHPDMYHLLYMDIGFVPEEEREGREEAFLVCWAFASDRFVYGETEVILPWKGVEVGKIKTERTEEEQIIFPRKVGDTQFTTSPKKDVPLKDYLLGYIGEPDEEINEGDITKLMYKLSDGTNAYVCMLNSGSEPILEFTYTYNPETNELEDYHEIVLGCDYEKYLPDDIKPESSY